MAGRTFQPETGRSGGKHAEDLFNKEYTTGDISESGRNEISSRSGTASEGIGFTNSETLQERC